MNFVWGETPPLPKYLKQFISQYDFGIFLLYKIIPDQVDVQELTIKWVHKASIMKKKKKNIWCPTFRCSKKIYYKYKAQTQTEKKADELYFLQIIIS